MEKIDFLPNGQWQLIKMAIPNRDYREGELDDSLDMPDASHKMIMRNTLPNGLEYRSYKVPGGENNNKTHILYHPKKQEVLAMIDTADHGDHNHAVNWSQVHPAYAGMGLGKQLYLATLLHNGSISSDEILTPKAHNAWKDLSQVPGINVSMAPFEPGNTDRHKATVSDPSKIDHAKLFPKVL